MGGKNVDGFHLQQYLSWPLMAKPGTNTEKDLEEVVRTLVDHHLDSDGVVNILKQAGP